MTFVSSPMSNTYLQLHHSLLVLPWPGGGKDRFPEMERLWKL